MCLRVTDAADLGCAGVAVMIDSKLILVSSVSTCRDTVNSLNLAQRQDTGLPPPEDRPNLESMCLCLEHERTLDRGC